MTASYPVMPGEFEPHERTVMAWPCRDEIYPGPWMAEARAAHAEVARTIAGFEPVTMIANPGVDAEQAAQACGGAVEVVPLPVDDSWFRDTGPVYVHDGGRRVALDWTFNAWGGKFAPFDRDAAVASAWAAHAGHDLRRVPLVFEGGSITVDGAGTAATTAQCLTHPNRNPSLTPEQIEAEVCGQLGVQDLLWLPHGLALDDDTDGHVDNVAAFARPGVLVVQGCDDPDEDDWARLRLNQRLASGFADACSQELQVVSVPVLPFVEVDGRRLAVPYLNYYVGNGFVAVPTAGHAADRDMLEIIGSQYPGREVVDLPVGAVLALGGGGIHCITQQVPAPPAVTGN